MKNIIKILSIVFISTLSLVACRDSESEDLLNGFQYNTSTMGDNRFLYQEVTSADTLAQYNYTGKKLMLITGKNFQTNISYSGDRVSTISHTSTLANGDKVTMTQDFVYNTDVLLKIIEKKEVKTPSSVPGGVEIIKNFYATYDFTFNTQNKVESILRQSGEIISGAPYSPSHYARYTFSYDANAQNLTENSIEEGTINSGILSAPTSTQNFEYLSYDAQKSPYRLLTTEYLVHRFLLNNGIEGHIFSQETPKKYTHSGSNIPIPQTYTNEDLEYDADGYLKNGWQRLFEYRPF